MTLVTLLPELPLVLFASFHTFLAFEYLAQLSLALSFCFINCFLAFEYAFSFLSSTGNP